MNEGAKIRFDAAADTLGVDPAIRETMWRRIGDLQLSPDDPTIVFLAVAGVLEKAAVDIPAAVADFPQKAREAARDAIEPVTAAAIAAAREKAAAEFARTIEDGKDAMRLAAADALQKHAGRQESQARVLRIFGFCLVASLGVVFGYAGGRADQLQIRHGAEVLAARADAESWLDLMRANGNLTKTLRDNCDAGGKAGYVVQGVRACALPLWLDASPGAPARGAGRVFTVVGWIAGVPTALWVALGVTIGFLTRRVAVELGRSRSIRWLLEL